MSEIKDIVKVAVDAYRGNVEKYSVGQSQDFRAMSTLTHWLISEMLPRATRTSSSLKTASFSLFPKQLTVLRVSADRDSAE